MASSANSLVAAAVGGGEFVQEVSRKQREYLVALAQRRNEEGDHVQPIEKVFAKISACDFVFQVFVGGGDDAGVDLDRLLASDRGEAYLRPVCAALCPGSSGSCRRLRRGTSVPPSAFWNLPAFSALAPGNAPLQWPKSSLSIRSSGIAAQLTSTNISPGPQALRVNRARDQLFAGP